MDGLWQLDHMDFNVNVPKTDKQDAKSKFGDDDLPNFSLAYLGPQIWSNTMQADDLKLEPINLDELLDDGSLIKEVSLVDIYSLTSPEQPLSPKHIEAEGVANTNEGRLYGLNNQTPATHQNTYPNPSTCFDQFCSAVPNFVCPTISNLPPTPNIPTILADIPSDIPRPHSRDEDEVGSPEAPSDISITTDGSESPAKDFNYQPDITDVMISTPLDEANSTTELFDPRKRHFTDEELKPQPIIRKAKKVYVPIASKDAKYWHKREKNNVAAKRSREARRVKENQIAMRTTFLEKENDNLRLEVQSLRKELKQMIEMVNGNSKVIK